MKITHITSTGMKLIVEWTLTHGLADAIIAKESSLIERKDDAKRD